MNAHHVLQPAGSDAGTVSQLWWGFLGITTVVYLLVMVVLCVAIGRARSGVGSSPDSRLRSDARSRIVVGAAMAASLVILLVMLAGDFLLGKDVLGERSPEGEPVRITITGHQFWWQLEYDAETPGDRVSTANELVEPVNTPIELSLRSTDVIHSFWLPALAGKKDLIPGLTNTLRFSVLREGTYEGQCAEFCGYQHANMRTRLKAVPPAEFE
ncbi:MAG: cytochrome c oxidase subunit II, partial [Proteobacteria bacterium]